MSILSTDLPLIFWFGPAVMMTVGFLFAFQNACLNIGFDRTNAVLFLEALSKKYRHLPEIM